MVICWKGCRHGLALSRCGRSRCCALDASADRCCCNCFLFDLLASPGLKPAFVEVCVACQPSLPPVLASAGTRHHVDNLCDLSALSAIELDHLDVASGHLVQLMLCFSHRGTGISDRSPLFLVCCRLSMSAGLIPLSAASAARLRPPAIASPDLSIESQSFRRRGHGCRSWLRCCVLRHRLGHVVAVALVSGRCFT